MKLHRGQRPEDRGQRPDDRARKTGGPSSRFTALCPLPSVCRRRPGYTLLELLLATVIGMTLLAGLYIVMNMTVSQTQASREQADAEDVSRAVFNKVGLDLSSVLGPAPPKSGGTPANGAVTATTSDDGADAAAPATTGDGDAGDSPAPSAPATPAASDASANAPTQNFPFQVGVIGTTTQLTIFADRVPDVLATPGGLSAPVTDTAQQPSSLVRIDYWKATNGGALCRQERPWVTAEQTGNAFSLDATNESAHVIADEVTEVVFEYFDGTDWAEKWEGGSGSLPGPPLAVRVTLTFSRPNPRGGDPLVKTVSQVIAVRAAPGTASPTLTDPVTPTTTPDDPADPATGGTPATGASSTSGGATMTGGSPQTTTNTISSNGTVSTTKTGGGGNTTTTKTGGGVK